MVIARRFLPKQSLLIQTHEIASLRDRRSSLRSLQWLFQRELFRIQLIETVLFFAKKSVIWLL